MSARRGANCALAGTEGPVHSTGARCALGGREGPEPLSPQQIRHGLTWHWFRPSTVRDWRLTDRRVVSPTCRLKTERTPLK